MTDTDENISVKDLFEDSIEGWLKENLDITLPLTDDDKMTLRCLNPTELPEFVVEYIKGLSEEIPVEAPVLKKEVKTSKASSFAELQKRVQEASRENYNFESTKETLDRLAQLLKGL